MIISVWRYSHLALAVSSFLLLTVAALTGIILAAEPVMDVSKGYKVPGFDTITLAQTIPVVKQKLNGLQQLSVDDNGFVTATFTDSNDNDRTAYVHPLTGAVLGVPKEQSAFFQWVTALHRSLFLKETGRLIVGIVSFLLILIAVTGVALIIKRQRGIRRFFAPIERTGFAQYYHTVFGRIFLLFIIALAASGTYLSVSRFILKPEIKNLAVNEESIKEEPEKALKDFAVFGQTKLSQVKNIQFPFSDFPEDYYTLKLHDRELAVNQFTGDVLAEQSYPQAQTLTDFSLRWHTGRSHWLWAIIMGITSAYILFFIYSGLAITLRRVRGLVKNKNKPVDSEIILLVGSENGSTYLFAASVYKQLQDAGKKVFVTDMDKYTTFPRAKQLVIMASTYGDGDAPSNAEKFLTALKSHPQQGPVDFTVLGFGSRGYRQFCQFAQDVHGAMMQQPWATPLLDFMTVDDASLQDFSNWQQAYTAKTGIALSLPQQLADEAEHKLEELLVVHKTAPAEEAFIIQLKPPHESTIRSGDLLAIYPAADHRERLYSIGIVNGAVQLSVKQHPNGLGSSFLGNLQVGEKLTGRLVKNEHFHFPRKASQVLMICNGTGIAPFLGMISENVKGLPIRLYCGFRTSASFSLYQDFLQQQVKEGKLQPYQLALSREGTKQYVAQLLQQDLALVKEALVGGGVLMICGSLAMQKDVLNVLNQMCTEPGDSSVEDYLHDGKILMDCY